MNCSFLRSLRFLLCLSFVFISITAPAQQEQSPSSKPINLDKESEETVAPDRAASYYHYSVAKWHENNGDMSKALSEMRIALKYNRNSPTVYLEMANLLEKSGNSREAIEYANEACRLDPQDPDPHWLLFSFYLKPQQRFQTPAEGMQKAIQELEKLKELSPDDERVYFALGSSYFEIDQPEKAIQALEKFQSLTKRTDAGYREIAKYYERTGNEEKAIEYLKKGLETQPDSADSIATLGNLYAKLNKNEEAVAVYQKLHDITGNDPNVSLRLAALLVETNKYADASRILDEVDKELNKNAAAQKAIALLRARTLIGLKKFPEAIEILKSIITEDSNLIEAYFYLGRAYELSNKNAEAIATFTALLQITSEEAQSNRFVFKQHLAANYMEMENYDKAIIIYQEMAAQDPDKANSQLLNAYRLSRKFDKAIPLGKQLSEKNPDDIDISIIYSRSLVDAGKAKEGIDLLSKLMQTKPEEIDLYINLNQIFLQEKRYEDAEKILLRAKTRKLDNENNEKVLFQLAQVYEKQEKFDRAELTFKEILKTNPDNAVTLNYIGYMLADRGVRLEEALRYVKRALAIDPRNGAYLDSLGWAFFKLNDLVNAETYLLESDEIIKNDPVIHEHLGDLYSKTGNLQKALDYYQKSHDRMIKSNNPDDNSEDIKKVSRKLDMIQDLMRKQKSEK
jgi:tetratricopeptide (TPR) repeat protein